MEDFESKALASTQLQPQLWKRFVDDTFILWPHSRDKLELFLQHLNNQSRSIQFTMNPKVNGSLPFLDVLVSKKGDGSFSHQIFHKKTHTEQYLHVATHNYPSQKLRVLNTLATHVLRFSKESHLEDEKTHMLNVFERNGYNIFHGIKDFLNGSKGPKLKK